MSLPNDDAFHNADDFLSGRVASPDTGGMYSPSGLADAPVGENVVAARESLHAARSPLGAVSPAGIGGKPAYPAGNVFFAPDAGAGEI